ncbi:MAG: RNA 2',3'-cyclic phosphodiesterase [Gammaproteobacteria bacterium]
MDYRLFLAIPLDSALQHAINLYNRNLAKAIKPVPLEKLHLTVRFFGDLSDTLLPKLIPVIENTLLSFPVFTLKPEQCIIIPQNKIRLLALNIEPNDTLSQLFNSLEAHLREIGIMHDPRPFLPHITLGKMIDESFDLSTVPPTQFERQSVTGLTLFNSISGQYQPVYHFDLKA